MSRRASRSSFSGQDQNELYLECKAAYLSLYDDIKDEITSKEDLVTALQQTGRNPSTNTVKKYWSSRTDSLTFDDFVDICRKEPVTTEDDLMKAFRKIDINGDGYLSVDELYKIMSTKGEKMTRDEVRKMIDEVDENKDGRLDYGEFCKMVISTTNQCKKAAIKVMEKKEKKRKKEHVETSLRKEDIKSGSLLSLKSSNSVKSTVAKMGSQQSIRSQSKDGSSSSAKMGSQLSIRSQSRDDTSQKRADSMLSVRSDNASKKDDSSEGFSGSRTSLMSAPMSSSRRSMLSIGEKELSTPVPAQRKSLAHSRLLDEDDLPRPSPRSKKDRIRGGAAGRLDRLPEPKNLRSWTHKSIKGCFFVEEDGIVCHQYNLSLNQDSKVWITIQPTLNKSMDDSVVDTALYIVEEHSKEGECIAFTELRDSKGKYGVQCDLSAGDYCVVPMTTGCHLKSRTREPKQEVDIIKKNKNGQVVLTSAFKKALEAIFDICDLDGNGLINREEFGWFNKRTSDEIVTDEEWDVVEDRIDLEGGQITKQGFLQLHQMEADDLDDDDPEELWLTLSNFGFNKELVMDEACPFKIDIYAEDDDSVELKVNDIDSMTEKVKSVVIQSAVEKGDCTKVKGMKDLFLYTYINDGRATIVVDNKSHSRVKLDVDCSNSKNCLSNTGSLDNTVTVSKNSQEIGVHLVPADESRDWTVRCTESIK